MTDISSQEILAIHSNALFPAPLGSFYHFFTNFESFAAYYHRF